jgi:hypothetical protein
MIHVITVTAMLFTCIFLFTPTAGAKEPLHEQLPLCLGPFGCGTFELAGVCAFPVRVALQGDIAQTTFFDKDDNPIGAIQTGRLGATLTNVANNRSTSLDFGGPGILTFRPDGSVYVRLIGPTLLPIPGETLLYNAGTIELAVASNGSISLVKRVGLSRDMCAVLS